jgi:hypothetical protein
MLLPVGNPDETEHNRSVGILRAAGFGVKERSVEAALLLISSFDCSCLAHNQRHGVMLVNESQRIDHAYHENKLLLLIARRGQATSRFGSDTQT